MYLYFILRLPFLRFCGTTEFATGMWAGIELEHREGKNDGTVHGIRYFRLVTLYFNFKYFLKMNVEYTWLL